MKPLLKLATAAVVAAIGLPLSLQAHRQWMLPSATVLSGEDPWVTVDAAVSNDLFYFEHFPMRLDNLRVIAPDGTPVSAENINTGRYRSTFDVHLTQKGTYKLAVVNNMVGAEYVVNGETKQWRGSAEAFEKDVPKDAKDLKVSRTSSRLEVFVTSGSPTETVLKPTGVGLELVPVTHPNDLVAGEDATFGFLLDGKPAANLDVTLIPGGIRYRDSLGEIKQKTDKDGKLTVKFPTAGFYWVNATVAEGGAARRQGPPPGTAPESQQVQARERGGPSAADDAQDGARQGQGPRQGQAPRQGQGEGAGPRGPMAGRGGPQGGPRGMNGPIVPGRRASYIATLEVLPG